MRIGALLFPAVPALLLVAGCGRVDSGLAFHSCSVGRPDAAWSAEESFRGIPEPGMSAGAISAGDPLERQNPVDLDYRNTPVHRVLSDMATIFRCRVTLTHRASHHIHARDLRITARASRIPENLAFEVLRGQLEAVGLLVQEASNARVLGRPHLVVDRSRVREATVPL
jgi:hypothetical protein